MDWIVMNWIGLYGVDNEICYYRKIKLITICNNTYSIIIAFLMMNYQNKRWKIWKKIRVHDSRDEKKIFFFIVFHFNGSRTFMEFSFFILNLSYSNICWIKTAGKKKFLSFYFTLFCNTNLKYRKCKNFM